MKPMISEDAFAVLLAQTGLPLSAEQKKTLHGAYGYVEQMAARISGPRPREVEPAMIFRAGAK
jgi:hypothetical protein